MKKKLGFNPDFNELLQNLPYEAKNACLLEGEDDGWQSRLAWNPCASYVLPPHVLPGKDFYGFVKRHQNRGRLLVGFLSYDLGLFLHGIESSKKDELGLPAAAIFAYDNYLEKQGEQTIAHHESADFIDTMRSLASQKAPNNHVGKSTSPFNFTFSKQSYDNAFEEIKKYIYDGVIYQINLTQKLKSETDENPRRLYSKLSARNTGKMKAYLEGSDYQIISMSPERFVKTVGSNIETSPIKGTRARGASQPQDGVNIRSLLEDEKEKAELNMITDLLRNDLGKVCSPGSVKVAKEREIQMLSKVIHTYSVISGRISDKISPLEALVSMFPGGSITGCPKHRAMEIIDELEPTARGAYCGSIFYINDKGDLDSSILIRTLVKSGRALSLSVGSGIVYDSILSSEYRENLDKAVSITEALG